MIQGVLLLNMIIHRPLACHFVDSYFTDIKIINVVAFAHLPNYLIENKFGIDTTNTMKFFFSAMEQWFWLLSLHVDEEISLFWNVHPRQ